MATNNISKGENITISAPAAAVSGAVVQAGSITGIAQGNVPPARASRVQRA